MDSVLQQVGETVMKNTVPLGKKQHYPKIALESTASLSRCERTTACRSRYGNVEARSTS